MFVPGIIIVGDDDFFCMPAQPPVKIEITVDKEQQEKEEDGWKKSREEYFRHRILHVFLREHRWESYLV